jgi:hypothetical protein
VFQPEGNHFALSPVSSTQLVSAAAANLSRTPIVWQEASESCFGNRQPSPPVRAPPHSQARLSQAAVQQLMELHNGENDLLQPLEAHACADIIGELREAVSAKFGGEPVSDALALVALEISRHLPDAHGWPTAQGAFSCFEKRGAPPPPQHSLHPATGGPVFPPSAEKGGLHASFVTLPTLPRVISNGGSLPRVTSLVNPFAPASSFPPPPRTTPLPTPARLFTDDASNARGTPRSEPGASSSSTLGNSTSSLSFSSTFPPTPPPPLLNARPLAASHLLARAREVRRAYSEGTLRRREGKRLFSEDGTDVEFAAPLSLSLEIDSFLQQRILQASQIFEDEEAQKRMGVPEEHFDAIWEASALELGEVIAEASGCSTQEAAAVIAQNGGDCSVSFLSILHSRGDAFQQQCAQASAVELKRRREECSLKKIVEDAAQQGRIPPRLASGKMIRTLQEHLPLNEILGHRYRIPSRKRSGTQPGGGRSRKVSFGEGGPSDKEEDDDEDELDDDDSDDGRDSRYGGSDMSSYAGDSEVSDNEDSSEEEESDEDEAKSPRKRKVPERRSNLMAAPPPSWTDGDAPHGGFYLDTFTRIYQGYKSFTSLHGKSLSFKSLIQHDIEPTVMMELGISKSKQYQKLSDQQLLKRIKKSLGFQEDDYYVRKLELLKLPPCNSSKPSSLYCSFRKLTTPFLRILREAKDSGARLRSTNVSRIFKNHIRGVPALERWFLSKRFKTFNDAVRHISKELHSRIATEVESHHDELVANGQVSGARSDVRGGKSEPGKGKNFGGANQNFGRHQQHSAQRKGSDNSNQSKRARTDERNADSARDGRPARSAQEEAAFQTALAREKALPSGMYHHPRGPFCKENPCRAKLCQGCNYHAGPDGNGHIRPNCRCKDHPDFVSEGYFHDKHPGRTGALSLPKAANGQARPSGSGSKTQFGPPPVARVRHASGGNKTNGGGQ